MERLRNITVHPNIHSAMERWLEGIRKVQARRKEEIVNATNRHRNGGPRHQEDKGTRLKFKVHKYCVNCLPGTFCTILSNQSFCVISIIPYLFSIHFQCPN